MKISNLLEDWLLKIHLPFWLPRLQPDEHGYYLDLDYRGERMPQRTHRAVAQARALWFCARLARSCYARDSNPMELARRGFQCFVRNFWDPVYGGVFWDASQNQRQKHLYAQAFALFAFSEYARMSGDRQALELSHQLYEKMDRCRDPHFPGYIESRRRDWSPILAATRSALGLPHREKTTNTQLHLLEAFTSYHNLTGLAAASLEGLLSHLESWKGGDRFSQDGLRLDDSHCFGHQLEYIWLRGQALLALGQRAVDSHSLLIFDRCQAGWDPVRGGYFDEPWQPFFWWRGKIWWVQAEALLATLLLAHHGYALSQLRYASLAFWIEKYQIDRHYLEWHALSDQPLEPKAGPWKTPYHVGRCLLEGLSLVQ